MRRPGWTPASSWSCCDNPLPEPEGRPTLQYGGRRRTSPAGRRRAPGAPAPAPPLSRAGALPFHPGSSGVSPCTQPRSKNDLDRAQGPAIRLVLLGGPRLDTTPGLGTRTSARSRPATFRVTTVRSWSLANAAMNRSGGLKAMPRSLPRATVHHHSRMMSPSTSRSGGHRRIGVQRRSNATRELERQRDEAPSGGHRYRSGMGGSTPQRSG